MGTDVTYFVFVESVVEWLSFIHQVLVEVIHDVQTRGLMLDTYQPLQEAGRHVQLFEPLAWLQTTYEEGRVELL